MALKMAGVGQLRRSAGFTLMELMITLAIVAILATVALASYRGQVVRSNRAAAEGFMLEISSKEERYLLDNRQYATSLAGLGMTVPAEVSGNYTVTVADNDTGSSVPGYIIRATPIASQLAGDTDCGTLTLNHLGAKTASGSGSRCWR
ncbi:MAG: type IV pilin protein [Pseudomonas sp.]